MAKMSTLDKLIPQREIYTEKNAGQNYQLCLPLLFQQKCLTIEKYLYTVVAHDDSHSRDIQTNVYRQEIYYRTINNTLNSIPMDRGYKKYLIKKVRLMTDLNKGERRSHGHYRTYVRRAIKELLPYGVIMFYKRRLG